LKKVNIKLVLSAAGRFWHIHDSLIEIRHQAMVFTRTVRTAAARKGGRNNGRFTTKIM
jgi:hypothetical protein